MVKFLYFNDGNASSKLYDSSQVGDSKREWYAKAHGKWRKCSRFICGGVVAPPPNYMTQARGRSYDGVLALSGEVGSTLKEG